MELKSLFVHCCVCIYTYMYVSCFLSMHCVSFLSYFFCLLFSRVLRLMLMTSRGSTRYFLMSTGQLNSFKSTRTSSYSAKTCLNHQLHLLQMNRWRRPEVTRFSGQKVALYISKTASTHNSTHILDHCLSVRMSHLLI